MKPSTVTTSDLHQQTVLLLPWYINQSLQTEDREQVENHIRSCLLCRRELVNLRKLATAVMDLSDLEAAAESSFASLRSKLPAKDYALSSSGNPSSTTSLIRFTRQRVIQLAIAASLLLTIIPLTLNRIQPNITDNFYTLSDARLTLTNSKQLRIVFAKSLSKNEIATILASIHGQQLGEPNSVGAITVRLAEIDSTDLDKAITLLRHRPDVLLAESMQP